MIRMENGNTFDDGLRGMDIAAVMFGFTFFSGSMLVGRQIAASMPIKDMLRCFFFGGLFLGTFGASLAYFSCKRKRDMMQMVDDAFGNVGRNAIVFLISITQIGWFGVGASMLSTPLTDTLFDGNKYIKLTITCLFGLAMLVSAAGGVKTIIRLSYLAVPIIFLLGCFGVLFAFNNIDYSSISFSASSRQISLPVGISLVIGTYISGAITTPNFTWNGKSPQNVLWISFLAYFLGNGIMLLFGAASFYLVCGDDIFDLFRYFGLEGVGFLTLGLNIWSSCDNGLYSAGLGLKEVTHIDRKKATIIAGVVGIVLSPFLYNYLIEFLTLLNKLISPIGAVLIVKEYTHKQCAVACAREKKAALFSMAMGGVAAIVTPPLIPAINGALVSTITYMLLLFAEKIRTKRKH